MENEIWKDIPQYEGYYKISENGSILSLKRSVNRSNNRLLNLKEKTLNPTIDKKGYLRVQLWKNNKGKYFRVHQLVAISFIDNPFNYKEVNHIDGDKLNNFWSNLEWCTPMHNTNEAIRIGLIKTSKIDKIYQGIIIETYNSVSEASKLNKINRSSIFNVLNGKYKQLKGFIWKYHKEETL